MKIKFHIIPNARVNKVVGMYNGALKIKLNSPPVDGKANEELIGFLSDSLGLSKSEIHLLHGHTCKIKIFEIDTLLSESEVYAKLISLI